MIVFDKDTKQKLIELYQTKDVGLEGNILKLVDFENDSDFESYIKTCIEKDRENRKRRLDITKQIQTKNDELKKSNSENERIMLELQQSLKEVEDSRMTFEVQNRELNEWKQDNIRLTEELKTEMVKSEQARIEAENAKQSAETDLDLLQKKKQTELIGIIVKVALGVIVTVGIITTIMYIISIYTNKDTQIIGSTWSNMFGILLTNAFSIIGTIMGVKYASKDSKE